MGILKHARKNKFINLIVRQTLKKSSAVSAKLHSYLIGRWTTSGAINCRFSNIKFKYYNECDDGLVQFFYYNIPYHGKNDLRLFIELAKSSVTVLDIGAHTGLFSVLASIANRNSNIHAIEPYSVNAKRMKINITLNTCSNVTIHETAMGANDGEVEFTVPDENRITDVSSINSDFSKRMYPNVKWKSVRVKLHTPDNFTKKNNLHPDLIKIDVETLEMEVFKGAQRILTEDKPTIIFECFLDTERKNFFNRLLEEYNYYAYLIFEHGVVHLKEGFVDKPGELNYLITPVKPVRTFISFNDTKNLSKELLLRPATF